VSETIDEITIHYEDENGTVLVKELDKEVLTRGSWTTIMFLYQELDKKSGDYGPPKVSIRRYQKRGGYFRQQSKFNISNEKQAKKIVEVLSKWF
jgi:hypothetical protein